MHRSPRHETVEARFRELLRSAGLVMPDRVRYEPASVVFLWDAPQVAVCVDFDEELPPAA